MAYPSFHRNCDESFSRKLQTHEFRITRLCFPRYVDFQKPCFFIKRQALIF